MSGGPREAGEARAAARRARLALGPWVWTRGVDLAPPRCWRGPEDAHVSARLNRNRALRFVLLGVTGGEGNSMTPDLHLQTAV